MLQSESDRFISLEFFVDCTKIEANASCYTFVWATSIKTNKEKMLGQLEEFWKYAQCVVWRKIEILSLLNLKKSAKKKSGKR